MAVEQGPEGQLHGGVAQGLGSALAVLLFLLVIPFMAFNIRRFRLEER